MKVNLSIITHAALKVISDKASTICGRVESAHKLGDVKRSGASSVTLADAQHKASKEERMAFRVRDSITLLSAACAATGITVEDGEIVSGGKGKNGKGNPALDRNDAPVVA